ncbi:MAG: MerR family transcriptional regulator [Dehalococcoidales bacterium]|jgi:MerR family transcriptional regulator/heat shock protein HspR
MNDEGRPCYVISVAAEMLGTRTHTLRYYEKVGIIKPFRSPGNIRLYTEGDIALMRRIRHLMNDLGVNIAGVEVILNILDRLVDLQRENRELSQELEKLKGESP